MFNSLSKFFFVIFSLSFSYGFSSQNNNDDAPCIYDCFGRQLVHLSAEHADEKLYLDPDMLHIDSDSLYVIFENAFVPVPAIFKDDRGVYITTQKWGFWYCENGHPNPPWRIVCAVCGKT